MSDGATRSIFVTIRRFAFSVAGSFTNQQRATLASTINSLNRPGLP